MTDDAVEISISPWLAVADAQGAVEYYTNAFEASEVYRLEGENGSVEVAQLRLGGAIFWVQSDRDSSPEVRGEGSVRIIVTVDDPHAYFDKAVVAGATVVSPVADAHGWRTGRVLDPFGHDWEFSRQLASPTDL